MLTYRKGRCRRINERRFVRRRAVLDGCSVDYLLHDEPVRFLKGKLRLRQVTRLCDGGHQTTVITSRWDLGDIEVAYRMFERWRQENFFKYMREEFLLDALVDYQIEPEDPRGEPCCTSCSPLQATSTSQTASLLSPWLHSARRIARTPPRRSVRSSITRRPSSPALACGCASKCASRGASGLPFPAHRSSAAPPRFLPRLPDRGSNRTFLRHPMSGGLNLVRPSCVVWRRRRKTALRPVGFWRSPQFMMARRVLRRR